jgi:hypothetical protein
MLNVVENIKKIQIDTVFVFFCAKDTFWNSLETPMVEAYKVPYQYINPLHNHFNDLY